MGRILLVVCAVCGCGSNADYLGESDLRELLSDEIRPEVVYIPLGEIHVVLRPDGDLENVIRFGWPEDMPLGSLGRRDFVPARFYEQTLLRLERIGLVEVTVLRDLAAGFTGWDDWLELTQQRVRLVIRVDATSAGSEFEDGNRLKIPISEDEAIDEIVQNEVVERGLERFRIVQGTLTVTYSSHHDRFLADQVGEDELPALLEIARDQKFRALLRYDVFDERWKFVTIDYSLRSSDFTTNHVNDALSSAGSGR